MNRKTEKGQVLVIIALAMIAILGITALAIDGSLVYNSRRADQSTADSAVLAGAGAASQVLKAGNLSQFTCGSTLTSQAATAAVNNGSDQQVDGEEDDKPTPQERSMRRINGRGGLLNAN